MINCKWWHLLWKVSYQSEHLLWELASLVSAAVPSYVVWVFSRCNRWKKQFRKKRIMLYLSGVLVYLTEYFPLSSGKLYSVDIIIEDECPSMATTTTSVACPASLYPACVWSEALLTSAQWMHGRLTGRSTTSAWLNFILTHSNARQFEHLK